MADLLLLLIFEQVLLLIQLHSNQPTCTKRKPLTCTFRWCAVKRCHALQPRVTIDLV